MYAPLDDAMDVALLLFSSQEQTGVFLAVLAVHYSLLCACCYACHIPYITINIRDSEMQNSDGRLCTWDTGTQVRTQYPGKVPVQYGWS